MIRTPERQIDFYLDFSSPYSYLAFDEAERVAARHAHALNVKPILLGILFRETGGTPLTEQHPFKAAYALRDFARSAEIAGLPFRAPSRFPQPGQNPARVTIWLQQIRPELANEFARRAFRLLFEHDGLLSDMDALAAIGRDLGIDEAALRASVQDADIKARLAANTEEARQRQVFGVPMFFVGDEPFWGNDRLAHVEHRIKQLAR